MKMSQGSQGGLPTLEDVPGPGLVPEAPNSVHGEPGVKQAPPSRLAELLHLCRLP